jgi:hypothetical protein
LVSSFLFDAGIRVRAVADVARRRNRAHLGRRRGIDRYKEARWPLLRDSTLRRLEGAHDAQEQREAANAFRGWAEFEGVLQA